MPVKMVKTKCVKEMAKELFTLFSGKVNSVLAQAIDSDENSVSNINKNGYIENEKIIYSNEYDTEPIEQNEVQEGSEVTQVNLDEI